MRLINVGTLAFEEFEDERELPQYGILSHRWEDAEITYHDAKQFGIQNLQKKGAEKIKACCVLAQQHNLKYVWVDTCCIDKSSSAELSEAINSMFRWYQLAHICFAYLCDIQVGSLIESSVWFTRAWTLQELIAPRDVLFLSSDWQPLGSKVDFADTIESRTRIPQEVLKDEVDIYSFHIAERMTWARERKCRRVEDIAYSLLGIFDINMPLLYGEGQKAFQRLQQEIIRHNNDMSILLWHCTAQDAGRLLAPSPDRFSRLLPRWPGFEHGSKPFAITNLGLSVSLKLIPWSINTYLVQLNVGGPFMAILLRRQPLSDRYERLPDDDIVRNFISTNGRGPPWDQRMYARGRDLFITLDSNPKTKNRTYTGLDDEHYGFSLSIDAYDDKERIDLLPHCSDSNGFFWTKNTKVLEFERGAGCRGVRIILPTIHHVPAGITAIKLGFDFDFRPCCAIRGSHGTDLEDVDLAEEQEWSDVSKVWDEVYQCDRGLWLIRVPHPWLSHQVLKPPKPSRCFEGRQIVSIFQHGTVGERVGWQFKLEIRPCVVWTCDHNSTSKQPRQQ